MMPGTRAIRGSEGEGQGGAESETTVPLAIDRVALCRYIACWGHRSSPVSLLGKEPRRGSVFEDVYRQKPEELLRV